MAKIIDIESYKSPSWDDEGDDKVKISVNVYEDFISDPDSYGTGYGKGTLSFDLENGESSSFVWNESDEETNASPYNDPYDFLVEILETLGYKVDIKVEYETDET